MLFVSIKYKVFFKHVGRIYRSIGLAALGSHIYPNLLQGMTVQHYNQVGADCSAFFVYEGSLRSQGSLCSQLVGIEYHGSRLVRRGLPRSSQETRPVEKL